MSLLRKIRRRHKAVVLKSSAQIHGEKPAAVFPVDDGEDGDVDEGAYFKVDSSQQEDGQNGDISVSVSHESHQMPISIEHFSPQTDDSAQSSIFIPSSNMGHGMQIIGKEGRFWFRVAKIAAFLLVTLGAFSVGKLAAMGITLTVTLACKLFARDRINSHKSFFFAETEQSHQSHESLPSKLEMVRLDSEEMVTQDSEAPVLDESNGTVEMLVGHLVTNASGHWQSTLQPQDDEEALDIKASGDTLLAQRKKLKRLNCIKIPPSSSAFLEAMEDSPSSSAKVSPRTWFRNAGNSTPTGKGTVASSAEMNKQGKFKSKVLLRHLRRKGEPQSAPSSPLSSSQEVSNNFCIASDGSDTERSAHRVAPVHRRSKFRPASPAKNSPVINSSMGLPDQQTLQTFAGKGERTLSPVTLIASEAMGTEVETSAFIPAGRGTLATEVIIPPSQRVEKMQSALTPATPDATMNVDIHSPLASTHELLRQKRGKDRSTRRPVTHVSQEGITAKAVASINQDSLPVAVLKGGEKRRRQVRTGTPWVAAGLMITLAGLFVGRTMAVTGLVCYWYALSRKNRKPLERRR